MADGKLAADGTLARDTSVKRTLKHKVCEHFYLVSSILQREDLVDIPLHLFRIDGVISYINFCDDFGPMNLGSIYQFCNIMRSEIDKRPSEDIGLFSCLHRRDFTNAVFLIGSYLIMTLNWTPAEVDACFQPLNEYTASYRDVSPGEQNFCLFLRDCWEGLCLAKNMGWANFESGGFDLVCTCCLRSTDQTVVLIIILNRTNISIMKTQSMPICMRRYIFFSSVAFLYIFTAIARKNNSVLIPLPSVHTWFPPLYFGLVFHSIGPCSISLSYPSTHARSSFHFAPGQVLPGKFVAMRGPKDLPGDADYVDSPGGARDFSPGYYSDILRQFGVRLVVRLNSPEYDAAGFEQTGIAVAELPFEDCTPPPLAVAAKFMTMAEGVTGSLAVHCRAGLGRTGTLIALYMIKHHGFSARQAIGWLRIVRPGRSGGRLLAEPGPQSEAQPEGRFAARLGRAAPRAREQAARATRAAWPAGRGCDHLRSSPSLEDCGVGVGGVCVGRGV